jgi:magnesium and cobalt exporter, CNNM family
MPLLAAFAISVFILNIFSVAIPHAWAKYAGTGLLVHCYPVLRFLEWAGWPLTTVFAWIDPLVKRLAGISEDQANSRLDEKQEELLNVVEEREKEGVVDEEEREMIASVLEFRDTTAGEIMTPRTEVSGIEADTSLSEAVEIVILEGHSRYPVYKETIDNISGMLYAKDLLKELNRPEGSGDISHYLRKPFFVPESKKLRSLLHNFQNQKVHVAVVLDEYGGTAGLVTIEDILEELVGEIVDEYEPPQPEPIKKIDEYTIEVDARYEVDELNDELDISIPEDEDYETIGGFIFAKLGHIPMTGETFEHENLQFTVIDAGERKINRLRIVITPPNEEPQDKTS